MKTKQVSQKRGSIVDKEETVVEDVENDWRGKEKHTS